MTEPNWAELLAQAQAARESGQAHAALQLCDRAALQSVPGRDAAARLRGDILLQLGDAAGALSSFDSVADPAVPDAALDCRRGLALFELVRFAEALGALRSALRGDPSLAEAHHALGVIAEITGSGDEAEFFRSARRLAPQRYATAPHRSAAQFTAAVGQAVARLGTEDKGVFDTTPILVQELPRLHDLRQKNAALSPEAFGTRVLMRQVTQAEGGSGAGPEPSVATPAILLFKRNLERGSRDEEALVQAIVETLRQVAEDAAESEQSQ